MRYDVYDEALITYTMQDMVTICKKYGLPFALEAMVSALNETSHQFTDDEKDLLGFILTSVEGL